MDWGATKNLVVQSLGYDGTTNESLSQAAIGTPTDSKLQLLLRNFSIETFSFFTRATPVTFLDGDWEGVDLTDGSRCTLSMSKILQLNLNGTMLCKADGVGVLGRNGLIQGDTTGIPAKGTPLSWAESDLGRIDFDRPVDMTATPPAWVAGWYRHPVLLYDTASAAVTAGASYKLGTCQIDDTLVFAWAKYASIFLSETVASASVAMERLKRYDVQAYNLIAQKKGENISRFTRGLFGRNDAFLYNNGYWGLW